MENTKELLPVDYFLVVARCEEWYVGREMAQAIEASLNQAPAPQWVMFVDLTGARVRVCTRLVDYIHQCTAEQRSLARAFQRARKAERKAEPEWDGDE